MAPFSFPALTASPPSQRNWYEELLNHPDCHGPQQVSEAYETHRATYLAKNLKIFASDTNPVTLDQALISHLQRQSNEQMDGEPSNEDLKNLEINCLGTSARPSQTTVSMIQEIQRKVSQLVGADFYSMPASLLHIAMVELAHRHNLAYLHSVSAAVGKTRLQKMLDLASALPSKPRLVSPRLSFDVMGIALTFLPDSGQEYTYHHLRAEMHSIALESGESFDMCYTAPSAHVTLGRFVGNSFFSAKDSREAFIDLIDTINKDLEASSEDQQSWILCAELSAELQAGYLKFGVERECADMLGKSP